MVVTWSDDESEDDSEDVTANVVKALTVREDVEGNYSDEEMTDECNTPIFRALQQCN